MAISNDGKHRQSISFILVALLFWLSCNAANADSDEVITHSLCGVTDESCAGHAERLQDYWTPERMRNARPTPMPQIEPADVDPTLPEVPVDPSWHSDPREPVLDPTAEEDQRIDGQEDIQGDELAKYRTKLVSEKERNRLPYSATGKVWYTKKGEDWVCSAAVVQDKLLVTASHCVYDTEVKVWSENFVFCAAYDYTIFGGCLYKHDLRRVMYTGRTAYINRGWLDSGDWLRDVALVACDGDDDVVDYTGYLGVDPDEVSDFNAIGYPAVKVKDYDFDGGHMWLSVGATSNCGDAQGRVAMWNNFTGGASGGPWTIKDPQRSSYLNGINSTKCKTPTDDQVVSPLLRIGFWNLWKAAGGRLDLTD